MNKKIIAVGTVIILIALGIFLVITNLNKDTKEEITFKMPIEDVYHIQGKGVVVVGTVELGSIKVNDNITIIDSEDNTIIETKVTSIEIVGEVLNDVSVEDGIDYVSLVLGEVDANNKDIVSDQTVIKK